MSRNSNNKNKTRSGQAAKTEDRRRTQKSETQESRMENKRSKDQGGNGLSRGYMVDSTNDPRWYALTPQLIQDAASLSFGNPLGDKVHVNNWVNDLENPFVPQTLGNIGTPNDGRTFAVPGIMRMNYALTAGNSSDNYSPINLSAIDIYSWVRHVNSGSRNYDAPDLMLYLMSVDSAYSFYTWCTRVYGCMMLAIQQNRYVGRALIVSMGLDYDDLLNNMANFRYFINSFAVRLGQLAVPNTMPIFSRHMWMNANIYTDAGGIKSQLYYWEPDGFYVYDELDGPGKCVFKDFHPGTLQEITDFGNNLLTKLLTSEDIGIMSGDIIKAYGSKLLSAPLIGDGYVVVPTYSMEVLLQIHNARFLGKVNNNNITQNVDPSEPNTSGALLCQPKVTNVGSNFDGTFYYNTFEGPYYLNFPIAVPTEPAYVMVATRMTPTVAPSTGGSTPSYSTNITNCGTEIPTSFTIYKFKFVALTNAADPDIIWEVSGSSPLTSYINLIMDKGTTISDFASWIEQIQGLVDPLSFDWAPLRYLTAIAGEIDDIKYGRNIGVLNDLQNYTTVTDDVLHKMHETALLSEFGVPQYR